MSNNGIPPLNDWQSDNYPVIYDEGDEALKYVKTGVKNTIDTGGSSYLVYTALLSQTGTDAPVPTILQNTLGGGPVWSYDGDGYYYATLTGAFTENKTVILWGAPLDTATFLAGAWGSIDRIDIWTGLFNAGVIQNTNNQIENTLVEIRVYP